MPSKAVKTNQKIYEVLKLYPIFHDERNLKTEAFKDPDGSSVWDNAARDLYPMKRHNLYMYVLRNRWNIKKSLISYHFPKFVKGLDIEQTKDSISCDENSNDSCKLSSDEKYDHRMEKIDIVNIHDEYVALHNMKFNIQFHSTIHRISLVPFHVMYWSLEQLAMFKQLLRSKSYDLCVILLQNALPSITQKGHTSQVNHIVSIVNVDEGLDKLTLFSHAIFEKLDYECIQLFCFHFFKSAQVLPSKICVAYHKVTLNEICFAINNIYIDEFNAKCLSYLKKETKSLPKVLISVDILEVLTSVSKSTHFLFKPQATKENLIKLLIDLATVINLKDFESKVSDILVILFSPFKDQNILNIISALEENIDCLYVTEIYEKFLNCPKIEYTVDIENKMKWKHLDNLNCVDYIDNIRQKSEKHICKKGKPNSYYCPNLYDSKLKFVLSEFTLWTGILENKNLSTNNLILQASVSHLQLINYNGFPTAITDFLVFHIMQCNEIIQRKRAIYNRKKCKNQKDTNDTNDTPEDQLIYLCGEENWKGLNECYKIKQLIGEIECMKLETNCHFEGSQVNRTELLSINLNCDSECNQSNFSKSPLQNVEKNVVKKSLQDEDNDHSVFLAGSMFYQSCSNINSANSALESAIPLKNSSSFLSEDNQNCQLQQDSSGFIDNKNYDFYNDKFEIIDKDTINENSDSNVLQCISGKKVCNTISNNFVTTTNEPNNNSTDSASEIQPIVNTRQIPSKSQRKNPEKNKKPVQKIKKKKYVTPCSDMRLRHKQLVKTRGKDILICNGADRLPLIIDYKMYSFVNTDKFDVFAEICSSAYKHSPSFRDFCNNSCKTPLCTKLCFIKTVTNFSIQYKITTLYEDRARLLYELGERIEHLSQIVINDTLDNFFAKLMKNHASFCKTIICRNCNANTIFSECVINANVDSQSVLLLEQLLSQFFMDYVTCNNICKSCSQTGEPLTLELGYYLGIYIEKGYLFDFVDIAPVYITLLNNSCKYLLVGVVTYASDDNPMYLAYCRRPITAQWDMRSGIERKIINCKNLTKQHIVFLVYSKVSK